MVSYRPADFLMFSPRIYWRLFESLNLAFWPLQAGIVGWLALAWLGWVRRDGGMPGSTAARAALAALALCWALTAWAFLWQRLAPIHWLAGDIAPLFALQAAGLLALAVGGGVQGRRNPRLRRAVGLSLLLWAWLGHPLLAWAGGSALGAGRVRRPGQRPDGGRHARLAAAGARPALAAARAVGRAAGLVPAQRRHLVDHGLGARLGAVRRGAAGCRGCTAWLMRCSR